MSKAISKFCKVVRILMPVFSVRSEFKDVINLLYFARRDKWLMILGFMILIFASVIRMMVPLWFGFVVDEAVQKENKLTLMCSFLAVIYIGSAVMAALQHWLFTLVGYRFSTNLRKALFAAIMRQEIGYFDINRTGDILNRLTADTEIVQTAVTISISLLLRYLIYIIAAVIYMFTLSLKLTAVIVLLMPVASLITLIYGFVVRHIRKEFQDKLGATTSLAEENITNIRTVRSFSAEEKARKHFNELMDITHSAACKLALVGGAFETGVSIAATASVIVVLWYGAHLLNLYLFGDEKQRETGVSEGVLTSFIIYAVEMAMAFSILATLYGEFMQAVGASSRIFEILERRPLIPIEGGLVLPKFTGSVEFQNVCFSYPNRPDSLVLKNVTFNVKAGEIVAIVGPSGTGKSTIFSLIQRFYLVDSGKILLGNANVDTLNPRWLSTQISCVLQEPNLFACSIRDNIAYGRKVTEEEIVAAAKAANAHDFIQLFDDGYDTLVGERGQQLSGGQKQRIAIARALIMNPKILLLDEATSALDAESEHLVRDALDQASVGRTVLVIAHRLSTMHNSNKVLVMVKGEIVESGTHESLLGKDSVYRRLVMYQLVGGEELAVDEDVSPNIKLKR